MSGERPLRLHWSPDSANLVVRLALEEYGLPYKAVRVDRSRGEHRAPGYLAMNPQGLIPVLEDGPLVLFETGAILWHLAERQGLLGPEGPPAEDLDARASVLKWLFYLSNTVHAELRAGFYSERYVDAPGTSGSREAVEALRRGLARRLRGHIEMLEGQVARKPGAGWLAAAKGPSLADLYLGILLRWGQLYPTGSAPLLGLGYWPSIHRLCRRIEERPAAVRAFAAEAIAGPRALTKPCPPDLPRSEVMG